MFGHSGASVPGCLTNMDVHLMQASILNLGDCVKDPGLMLSYVWPDRRCEYGSKVLSVGAGETGPRMKKARCSQ